jgi:hypothetical protein
MVIDALWRRRILRQCGSGSGAEKPMPRSVPKNKDKSRLNGPHRHDGQRRSLSKLNPAAITARAEYLAPEDMSYYHHIRVAWHSLGDAAPTTGRGASLTCWRLLRGWQGIWQLIHFMLLDWLARSERIDQSRARCRRQFNSSPASNS